MNSTQISGLVQLITGLLALAYQGYTLFHGVPLDPGHVALGGAVAMGGVGHMTNGRH